MLTLDPPTRGRDLAYPVLRERDPARQRELIVSGLMHLLGASAVRPYAPDPDGVLAPCGMPPRVPRAAQQMEEALLPRAVAAGRSLLSTHPRLAPELRPLADTCAGEAIVTHVLLVRAYGQTHGVYSVHWLGRERPAHEARAGFYRYWDEVGFAVAATQERMRITAELAELRQQLLRDEMTGLPNGRALDRELHAHQDTTPLSVLSLDFDGMREANNVFKSYTLGGDVLIKAVGIELGRRAQPGEFAARQHDTGDEFVLLLPGADADTAMRRAAELEADLDALRLEDTAYQRVYHGASVGSATRRSGETPGQALGRATVAMHDRKAVRQDLRLRGQLS